MQTIVQTVLLYVLIGCDDDIHIAVDVVRHIIFRGAQFQKFMYDVMH